MPEPSSRSHSNSDRRGLHRRTDTSAKSDEAFVKFPLGRRSKALKLSSISIGYTYAVLGRGSAARGTR